MRFTTTTHGQQNVPAHLYGRAHKKSVTNKLFRWNIIYSTSKISRWIALGASETLHSVASSLDF